jgi:hypothetical protein
MMRASVQSRVANNVVTILDVNSERSANGGHTGCKTNCDVTFFRKCQRLFEQSLARIIQARVNVNRVLRATVDIRAGKLLKPNGAAFRGPQSKRGGRRYGRKYMVFEIPLLATEFAMDENRPIAIRWLHVRIMDAGPCVEAWASVATSEPTIRPEVSLPHGQGRSRDVL